MRSDPSNPADSADSADLLGRATQALRDVAVPEGPSPELVAATQESLRRAEAEAQSDSHRIFVLRPTLLRVAAAIAILCGTAIVIYYVTIGRTKTPGQLTKQGTSAHQPSPGQNPAPNTPHTGQPSPPSIVKRDPAQVPAPPVPARAVALADGMITGRVLFDGVPPKPMPLGNVYFNPDCLRLHGGPFMDESLVVSPDRGLANVVVSVSEGLSSWLREEFPPPTAPAVLDQKGCVFVPHVVAVMVGQPLVVKNSDPMTHNVNVMAVNNPSPNLGQASDGETETEKFQSPEVFRIHCAMHPWMEAWVRVLDNPFFAVTGPNGRFTLRGLPPGTYTIKAWHEQLGVREMQVTIAPGHGASVDFSFPPASR